MNRTFPCCRAWASGVFLTLAFASTGVTFAQTGVSDDRVSLPEGPGSLEGVGDDVSIDPNMGTMAYTVPMNVPEGFPGLTPPLSLGYSSGAGSGVVGIGWSFATPSIERLTLRGVPEYDATDEFEADDGAQLVLTETNGEVQTYRARCESGFVRYTWNDVGDGSEGYFLAERPDGTMCSYGADRDGTLVDNARLGDPTLGTFRYLPVECWDGYGHRVEYEYGVYGGTTLLEQVGWVFEDGSNPNYEARMTYEPREDHISNATGGFEEVLQHRLVEIRFFVRATQRNRYELVYEDYEQSGGFSRLAEVRTYGVGNELYPASFTFSYSAALGELCDGDGCDQPYVAPMPLASGGSSLGVNLQSGNATLLDFNGDGLPDLVDTTEAGAAHRLFINVLEEDGDLTWEGPFDSTVGTQNGHDLSDARVQVLDFNGDGFTDLMSTATGDVLVNRGEGDWDRVENLFGGGDTLNLDGDFSEGELQTVRFIDYDNDRRIDIIRSAGSGDGNVTQIWRNTGAGFALDESVEPIGAGFDSDTLELNDFNGDGLLDAVQVLPTSVRYRLNLGYGRWAPWRTAEGDLDLTPQEAEDAELEDINGDALADLVLVSGNTVRLWINRNGLTFDAEQTIDSTDVDTSRAGIPERLSTTTVLFADMNGNGSSDVVWITQDGETTYLELFPLRPNLLSRIENGMGMVIDVEYGTSAEHMARAGGVDAWQYRVPFPNLVVDRLDEWDRLTNVHQYVDYAYRDGFYDGVEKAFRGFESVEERRIGDESMAEGAMQMFYDIGATTPCRAGRLLTLTHVDDDHVIGVQEDTYELCPLAGVPTEGLLYDVEFWCMTQTEAEVRELAEEEDWIVQRTTFEYDGYGRQTREHDHGVVSIGGSTTCGPCDRADGEFGAPCGAGCLGDEKIVTTDFVEPGEDTQGTWVLNLPYRERLMSEEDSDRYEEILTYYDGPAFEGLPLGQGTNGFVSRITQRVDVDGRTITAVRARADEHGNVVEQIGPLGEVGGDSHIRTYTYDDDGLRETSAVIWLGDRGNGVESLRQTVTYDPIWDMTEVANSQVLYRGETPLHDPPYLRFTYDAFGRDVATHIVGDDTSVPTYERVYDVSPTLSSVQTLERTGLDASEDRISVTCTDGRGQVYQTRIQLADGDWLVSGFDVYNVNGLPREVFQGYRSDSGACDTTAPDGVLSSAIRYDSQGRRVEVRHPDGHAERMAYEPLGSAMWDENDLDEDGPHFDTPEVMEHDGLERITRIGRTNDEGEVEWYTVTYDSTDGLARLTDPAGNARVQEYDLMAQLVRVDDPDRGVISFDYDDGGNITGIRNDAGDWVIREFDGAGRLVGEADANNPDEAWYEVVWDDAPDCPEGFCTFGSGEPVGMRFAAFDGEGAVWIAYDERGNTTATRQLVDDRMMEVGYRHDARGEVVGIDLPGGRTVNFTVDGAGNVVEIDGILDDVTFGPRGELSSFTTANRVTTTLNTDDRMRMTGVDVQGPSGTVLDLDFVLDPAGRLTEVRDESGFDGPSLQANYGYDALNRLVRADLDDGAEVIEYAYDAAENLISRTSSLGSDSPIHDGERVIDSARPHQVTQAGALSYAYDGAGRMTQRGEMTLTWNALGRLVSTQGADGAVLGEHVYVDDDSRAMSRVGDSTIYYLGDNIEIQDGVVSWVFAYGGASIARLEYADFASEFYADLAPATVADDTAVPAPDGIVTAADAWLAHADEAGYLSVEGGVTVDGPTLLAAAAASSLLGDEERTTFLHRDHLGSLAAVTDAAGEVIERTVRYPYGSVRATTTDDPERLGFTDARVDAGTDLVVMGLRAYDPHLGRWTSPDPAFQGIDAGEVSRAWEALGTYVYSLNAPTVYQDDAGTWGVKTWIGAIAGSTVTGAVGGFVIGGLVGGPVGAIFGGVLGGIVGFGAGMVAKTRHDDRLREQAELDEHMAQQQAAYEAELANRQREREAPSELNVAPEGWYVAFDGELDLAASEAVRRLGDDFGDALMEGSPDYVEDGPVWEMEGFEEVGFLPTYDDEGVGEGRNLGEQFGEFPDGFDGEPEIMDAVADDMRTDGAIDMDDGGFDDDQVAPAADDSMVNESAQPMPAAEGR